MLTTDTASLLRIIDIKDTLKGHYCIRRLLEPNTYHALFQYIYPHMPRATHPRPIYHLSTLGVTDIYFMVWLVKHRKITQCEINTWSNVYRICLIDGNLKIAKAMQNINTDFAMTHVIDSSNLHRVKCVYNNISTVLTKLPFTENLEITKWLYEKYPNLYNASNIVGAMEADNLEYVEWYCETYGQRHHADLILMAAKANKFKTFIWLYNKYGGDIDDIIKVATGSNRTCNDVGIIVWLTINHQDRVLKHVI